MEDIPTSGGAYAYKLLESWFQFKEISDRVRAASLSSNADQNPEDIYAYVSLMTSLWKELEPKVKGRSDFKADGFEAEFMRYKQFWFNPSLMLEKGNQMKMYEMELTLREAFERLKITVWEA